MFPHTYRLARFRRVLFALAALVVLSLLPATGNAQPARAAGGFSNAAIADVALQYVGQNGVNACIAAGKGTAYPGECKQFVNCIVYLASNHMYYPVYGSGYQAQFAAVGVEVSGSQATKGDVIQVGDSASDSPHTAIVLQNFGNGTFSVVDSNWVASQTVGTHNYTPPSRARFWRIGDVGGSSCTAPPLSSPGNGATVTSDTVTFSWGNVGCSHNGWTLRVRTDTNFDDPNGNHLYDQGVGQTELSRQVTINGHDNQTLYWALRTANPVGPWTIWSFHITPAVSPPGAPGNVVATGVNSSQIYITWNGASGASGYRIKRWNGSTWPVLVDNLSSGTTSYTDGGLSPNSGYSYFVCAFNSGGETCNSSWVSGTTLAPIVTAPAMPTNANATALSTRSILFTWTDSSDNEDSFSIYRWSVPDGQQWVLVSIVGANSTSFTDSLLQDGTTYWYDACATNGAGTNCGTMTSVATRSWSVTLGASAISATTGTSVTLTATAVEDVGPTPYYIVILASDNSVVTYCSSGTSCTATVSSSAAGSQTYYAVVGSSNGALVRASSGTATVTWTLPWSVTLGASATRLAVGSSVNLTATANQDVGPTPYYLVILASDNSVVGVCGYGTTCTAAVWGGAAGSETYHAVVGTYSGDSPLATSGATTVTWALIGHLVLSPADTTVNPGVSQAYTATAFDATNNSLGDVTSGTTFAIDGGGSCTGASCSSSVTGDHTVTGSNGSAVGTATLHVTGVLGVVSGSTYHAITPTRVLDTRANNGLGGRLLANTPATFQVAGRPGIPPDAKAVTGNVTVVNPSFSWAVYLGPDPIASPGTSTINFSAGQVTGNGLTVALSSTGSLSATFISTAGNTTDLVFDVTGYFTLDMTGSTYHPISPARLLDTRANNGLGGRLLANTPATFQVAGRPGIPPDAKAVTGNVTVVNPTFSWAVYLGPDPEASPSTSTINFNGGEIKGNSLTVSLSDTGSLSATFMSTPGNTTDLVFDVTGYYTADASGAVFVPIAPTRMLDTRSGNGLGGKLLANTPAAFTVADRPGVPSTAIAVTGNVTVVNETNSWAVFLGPDATPNPSTSTINFSTGDVKGNGLTVALGPGGTLSATYMSTPGNTTDLVFDVTGYFVPAGG